MTLGTVRDAQAPVATLTAPFSLTPSHTLGRCALTRGAINALQAFKMGETKPATPLPRYIKQTDTAGRQGGPPHTHTHAHARTHMHTHMRAHTHTRMHAHTHAHTEAHTHMHAHTYTRPHTGTCARAHTHTSTHTNTPARSLYLSVSVSVSLSLSLSLSLTHTHTHARTHARAHALSLSLSSTHASIHTPQKPTRCPSRTQPTKRSSVHTYSGSFGVHVKKYFCQPHRQLLQKTDKNECDLHRQCDPSQDVVCGEITSKIG